MAKYYRSIGIRGNPPSAAETYLIFNAIRSKTIKDIPTFSQTTTGGIPQIKTYTALFWSSTQENIDKAYAWNMSTEDLITGGQHKTDSHSITVRNRDFAYFYL